MSAPKLRFKEFGGDWNNKRLDSFLQRKSNPVSVIQNELYTQIGIRSHGKGIFYKEPIEGYQLGTKKVFWIEPNSLIVNIVFAWERAVAVTSKAEEGMVASHRFPMYLPKNNLSSVLFLKYLFITDKGKNYLELASPGGAGRNKTLGQANFNELKIDLPKLKEQTKIATFFTAIDEKISQLSQKQALLSQYKKSMMQKLFSQQIRFKADDGSEFEEWEEKKLGTFAMTFSGGTPTSSNKDYYNGDIPFIKSGEISLSFTNQFINEKGLNNSSAKMVNQGDLLYALYGATSGQVAISQIHGAINQAVLCIRSEQNNTFLYNFFISAKDDIISTYLQGGQGNLSAQIIKNIDIPIPTLPEQTKIANFLSAIDQKIDLTTQQLEQAKQWKKGLLQQMFV
ncbi:hypothetical protein P256_00260 [Acinetobacter nectaris CIP 110549]|uniref:Type I restriction modification DNA specificity domain-containing protein n=1 Tax=Acinetobacter nectaris CIP 110549 TaxID=1392540 RepID=V2TZE0_9GAMM|nr:restriction endonuclease subunit S [Acinetobacter nectaris]ESK41270.1 hypothetical protein P256_00260 [Acinetobacter nectaris CIP 110549]